MISPGARFYGDVSIVSVTCYEALQKSTVVDACLMSSKYIKQNEKPYYYGKKINKCFPEKSIITNRSIVAGLTGMRSICRKWKFLGSQFYNTWTVVLITAVISIFWINYTIRDIRLGFFLKLIGFLKSYLQVFKL